jgi:hypothetical protein
VKAIAKMSGIAADPETFATADVGHLPVQLAIHAGGGLAILIIATTLSIFKPWGRTGINRKGGPVMRA